MDLKHRKTKDVKEALDECCGFLSLYLPLANAHASDFITEGLWESLLSLELQKELLKCEEQHLTTLPGIVLRLSQDYLAGNHSEMCKLCQEGNANLSDKTVRSDEDMCMCGTSVKCNTDEHDMAEYLSWPGTETPHPLPHLQHFMSRAARCSLYGEMGRKILTSVSSLTDNVQITQETKMDLMSDKKSHEVIVMADMSARLAHQYQCGMIVDVGSGKGYLATHLASRHKLPTLAIDSSESNTRGAISRAKKLNTKQVGKKSKTPEASAPVEDCISDSDKCELTQRNIDAGVEQGKNEMIVKPQGSGLAPGSGIETSLDYGEENLHLCDQNAAHNANSSVMPELQHGGYPSGHVGVSKVDKTIDLPTENAEVCRHLVPITHFLSPQTDLMGLVKSHFPARSETSSEGKLLLTGLHTCGDLASSMLSLFTSVPDIQAFCGVGCCYNLLTEQFPKAEDMAGAENHTVSDSDSGFGFPLSDHLKKHEYKLGKAARNLAAQSLHRINRDGKLQGKLFFGRALLEKIIKDLFGSPVNTRLTNLRKLQQKSTSLYDYVVRAFHKLSLPTDKLTPDLVEHYVDLYKYEEFKMAAFFQLRTLLAPCIETVILLDRVCYLLERESVDRVDLLELFDPVLSPRCYCLIASK